MGIYITGVSKSALEKGDVFVFDGERFVYTDMCMKCHRYDTVEITPEILDIATKLMSKNKEKYGGCDGCEYADNCVDAFQSHSSLCGNYK